MSPSVRSTHADGLNRRLAAVMFTDMAGYTALMQRDEAAALRSREAHRNALEQAVPAYGGEVLQYFGDGSLSIFSSSVQAVEAAVEIQQTLGGEPPLRIGLHVGDIAYDEQGAFGDAINIAARLEALSAPGGILISQNVFDDIKRLPALRTVPSGAVRLKNVKEAVRTYAVAVDGVAVPDDPLEDVETEGAPVLPTAVRRRLEEHTRLPTFARAAPSVLARVPLIGREGEVRQLRELMDQAEERRGGTAFFRGLRGVGKSRLGQEAAEYAKGRGWTVLSGRAFPAESMVPFALFSDAFLPVLQGLEREHLSQLVPGGEDAIFALFPALGGSVRLDDFEGQPGEVQARLHWHFAGLVSRLAEYRPLLVVLEDLDFADRSSLELFHFLARHCAGKPVFLIGQYTGMDEKRKRELMAIEQSLISMRAGHVFELDPLDEAETKDFIRRAFDLQEGAADGFAARLHHWTGGNPFFLTGTLRGLIESGRLVQGEGGWSGIDADELVLPRSMRDAVFTWVGHLSETALELARLISVMGTQVTYEVLVQLSESGDADEVSAALDELLRHQILVDSEHRFALVYDFRHPLIRETLRSEMSLGDRRRLHGRVAECLEAYYGDTADLHADELAYHFGQASQGGAGARAIHYLATAGRNALKRHANREAEAYLQEALDRMEASPPGPRGRGRPAISAADVMKGLARARRRLGATQESVALWRKVLAQYQAEGDQAAVARARREIALAFMAGGGFEEAVEEFEQALVIARTAGAGPLVIRILLGQGYCYHAVGRREEAEEAVRDALVLAEQFKNPELVGRVHSALMRLHIWTGQLDKVRTHAKTALALAAESGDRAVEFWSQWAMGAMEGLIGHTGAMAGHLQRARQLADDIGSPLLRLEITELEVELAYARGEWEEGLEMGTDAIELARSLDARTILPRLLVWVSLIHLGRGEIELADALTREAWEVSGAGRADGAAGYLDVHTVVPAHIGRAAYHITCHEWGEAVRIAQAGLSIADRTGYIVWAIHHIIPILGEASIHARDLGRAREVAARMRREAEAVGHPLGLAWADAGDAAITWLEGGAEAGAVGLRKGAEAMEGIPMTYEAAKLRRQLAGRLAEIGDREGAIRELRHVHAVFERLGARPELEKTLLQFEEVGVEPPG